MNRTAVSHVCAYYRVARYPWSVSISALGTQLSPIPSVGLSVGMSVASPSQRLSSIVIPFCLSVCQEVCRSFRDLEHTTIDRSQPIWSAGIYLSSDPRKPFWIPCLPYFGCQREKYAKFRLFPTRRQWVMPSPTRPTIRDRVC